MTVKEGETTYNIEFSSNPKLDALMELLKEIPETSKVIVFNEFITSGDIICEALKQKGIKHVRVYSKTSDKVAAVEQFQDDPDCKILVGSRSVCYGLNLQVANYIIVFESPDSTIKRTQLERRIRRSGQTKKTYIYDLVVKGSIDEKVLRSLRSGKSLIQELIGSEDPATLLI
jgi:SNF2 family DNA or RNA helicase